MSDGGFSIQTALAHLHACDDDSAVAGTTTPPLRRYKDFATSPSMSFCQSPSRALAIFLSETDNCPPSDVSPVQGAGKLWPN